MGVLVYPTVCALNPVNCTIFLPGRQPARLTRFFFPRIITLGKCAWCRERCRSGHNGTVLKTVGGATLPWVRIPPSPPLAGLDALHKLCQWTQKRPGCFNKHPGRCCFCGSQSTTRNAATSKTETASGLRLRRPSASAAFTRRPSAATKMQMSLTDLA